MNRPNCIVRGYKAWFTLVTIKQICGLTDKNNMYSSWETAIRAIVTDVKILQIHPEKAKLT